MRYLLVWWCLPFLFCFVARYRQEGFIFWKRNCDGFAKSIAEEIISGPALWPKSIFSYFWFSPSNVDFVFFCVISSTWCKKFFFNFVYVIKIMNNKSFAGMSFKKSFILDKMATFFWPSHVDLHCASDPRWRLGSRNNTDLGYKLPCNYCSYVCVRRDILGIYFLYACRFCAAERYAKRNLVMSPYSPVINCDFMRIVMSPLNPLSGKVQRAPIAAKFLSYLRRFLYDQNLRKVRRTENRSRRLSS